jgi:hypothetical protein
VEPTIDFEANMRYFRGPGCAIVLAILLAITGLFTFSSSWPTALVVLALAAAAGGIHIRMRSNDPAAVDASLEVLADRARATAEARVGMFPHEAAPLEVVGFVRTRTAAGPLVQVKEQSGQIRTNWVGGFVAYFSEKQVHIFTIETCITAPAQSERTVEFFYEDVVSLSTESDQHGTRLSLTVKDGSRYDAPIRDVTAVDTELAAARELIRRHRA